MIDYPRIDPVAVSIGPLQIHWYALSYLLGFYLAWWLGVQQSKKPSTVLNRQQVTDLITNAMLGVILGGRIGYVMFYDFKDFLVDPIILFQVWNGGMSFHGGFLGVLVALKLFARSHSKSMVSLFDFAAPLTPLGLCAGRIANFINGELWGRTTDVSWAMIFPADPSGLPRHPSQLYQAMGEGLFLFLVLYIFTRKPRPPWAASGIFCLGYGVLRFLAEFFREPDYGIGFVLFDFFTKGQLLSAPMILAGLVMLTYSYKIKR